MRASTLRRGLVWALPLTLSLGTGRAQAQLVGRPWIVDLNAGAPSLESGKFQLVGSGTLGYATPRLGGVAAGSLAAYDLTTPRSLVDNTLTSGQGEAWVLLGGPGDRLRVELRGEAGVALYDSTYIPLVSNAGFFHDETSFMSRGSLVAGARFAPNDRFAAALRLGGGVQVESYTYVTLDPAAPALLSDSDNTSFRGVGHLELRWRAVPRWFSLRMLGDASLFTITRSSLLVRPTSGAGAASVTEERFRQLDVTGRSSVDLDVLAVFGLMPAVFGGADLFSLRSSAGSTFTVVPVVGIGIIGSPGAQEPRAQ